MPLLTADKPTATTTAGAEQGVIKEARRRQRARRIRTVSAAMIAITAAIGTLLALTSGHGARREAPLHLAPEPSLASRRLPAGAISVRLSPNLEGGQAGWCVFIMEGSGGGGTCGPLPTMGHPLLTGSSGWSYGDSDMTTTEISAPRVAYYLVNGTRRVATKALAGLPYGLRVAVIHTPLHARAGQRIAFATRAPILIPLDARGAPIKESLDYGASWFRDWNRPAPQLKGPCQLHVSGLEGITAEWGQVATVLRPYPAPIIGAGFLSCMDTEYYLARRGIRASVLLDAANPGRAVPSAIPGMVPIPHLPGFYNDGPGQGFEGEPMTGRRQGKAWVVAAGGGRNAEGARVRLLRHLTVSLPS
jgi:hypothetical protein